ncbi:MAG: glycosyltransferase family A protein [Candidatus Omnitrophica bacterium]|nr:glycosyltransferase family A protein [Candidatus Omnitrophota bacterium]
MTEHIHTFAIPAYKDSPYLEQCILSLKNQTIKSDIIMTTSTPSKSLNDLSEKYQIPLYLTNSKSGIADDWSYAYNSAKTDYVTIAHQDDIYLPEFSELCLSAAKKYSNNLIIFTDYKEMYADNICSYNLNILIKKILLILFLFKQRINSSFIKKMILSFGNPINCSCVMYHKKNIGHFMFSKEYLCSLDWDTWLKIARMEGSFVFLNRKLVVHRLHGDAESYIQAKNNIRKKEDEEIFKRMWPKPIAKILANFYYLSSKITEITIHK